MANNGQVRIGVVGCGAISNLYFPVLARRKDVILAGVADVNGQTGRRVTKQYGAGFCTTDYREMMGKVDGIVICLPNALHAPVTIECLKQGVAVLCEKPMATTLAEANAMVEEAQKTGSTLAIANIRRFYWSSSQIREMVKTGQMGALQNIHAEEGEPFGWPTASGFFFDAAQSGGGVLIDVGSHLLDLLLWWLDGYPDAVRYRDDNFGGVEADAFLEMGVGGVAVQVKLSRLAGLRNRCRLSFEGGDVTVTPEDFDTVRVSRGGGKGDEKTVLRGPLRGSLQTYFERMVDDFILSIRDRSRPSVPGETVLPSIRLIEECYTTARRMTMPWLQGEKDTAHAESIR